MKTLTLKEFSSGINAGVEEMIAINGPPPIDADAIREIFKMMIANAFKSALGGEEELDVRVSKKELNLLIMDSMTKLVAFKKAMETS
jgi:hypothetical protein